MAVKKRVVRNKAVRARRTDAASAQGLAAMGEAQRMSEENYAAAEAAHRKAADAVAKVLAGIEAAKAKAGSSKTAAAASRARAAAAAGRDELREAKTAERAARKVLKAAVAWRKALDKLNRRTEKSYRKALGTLQKAHDRRTGARRRPGRPRKVAAEQTASA